MAIVSCDPNVSGWSIPDYNTGWGRIDLDSVLYFSGDSRELIVLDDTVGINTGQTIIDSFVVSSQIPLRVCLVWTDTAAAPNANPTLVNDLDLELIAPDATYYRGNQYSGGQSIANPTERDRVNVEECCRIDVPQTGTWRIAVIGQQVVFGNQSFAYVITGGIEPIVSVTERDFTLGRNAAGLDLYVYPNLVREKCMIRYVLTQRIKVNLSMYDTMGKLIRTVVNEIQDSGTHFWTIRDGDLAQGVYFIKLIAGEQSVIKKLVLLR